MATPFTDGGALDRDGLPRLVERALATGITGFTVLGIAGEAHRLTDDERRQVVETVVKEVRGRVPVAVGASASGTHIAVALARMAQDSGAQALMLAPPTGSRNLDAVLAYYHAVAAATPLPIVLQDEPVTTQVVMPPAFIGRVAAEISRVEAVKLEERPPCPRSRAACLSSAGYPFSGAGALLLLRGAVSRGGRRDDRLPYPEALRAIRDEFVAAGAAPPARSLPWLPLIRFESQPGSTPGTSVGIRKEILRRRGWIRSAYVRPPAPALDAETHEELTEILTAVAG